LHRALITISILGFALLSLAKASAAPIPGTDSPADVLTEGLEWAFSVSEDSATQDQPGLHRDVWRFRSVEPYSETHGERLFLRFSLSVYGFQDEQGDDAQFAAWTQEGKDGTGLTYAWVRIFQRANFLYRLDIPCTFSRSNVEKLASNLASAIFDDAHESSKAIHCFCGTSCVAGEYSLETGFQEANPPAEPVN